MLCGLGLLLMGLSSSWDERAFRQPPDAQLRSHTGILQKVTYSAPAKSPTLVEMVVYQKQGGLRHGYLRYGLHTWEERLKPYLHQEVTMLIGEHHQVWSVDTGGLPILNSEQIEQRLQGMKQAQQAVAKNIIYVGLGMVLCWLFFFRKQSVATRKAYF